MAKVGDIAWLAITAQEYEQIDKPLDRTESFSLYDYRERMTCSNPKCKHGGFSLVKAVGDLAKKRKTEDHGVARCKGKVTIYGSGMKDNCRHHVHWTANLRYKGAPAAS